MLVIIYSLPVEFDVFAQIYMPLLLSSLPMKKDSLLVSSNSNQVQLFGINQILNFVIIVLENEKHTHCFYRKSSTHLKTLSYILILSNAFPLLEKEISLSIFLPCLRHSYFYPRGVSIECSSLFNDVSLDSTSSYFITISYYCVSSTFFHPLLVVLPFLFAEDSLTANLLYFKQTNYYFLTVIKVYRPLAAPFL